LVILPLHIFASDQPNRISVEDLNKSIDITSSKILCLVLSNDNAWNKEITIKKWDDHSYAEKEEFLTKNKHNTSLGILKKLEAIKKTYPINSTKDQIINLLSNTIFNDYNNFNEIASFFHDKVSNDKLINLSEDIRTTLTKFLTIPTPGLVKPSDTVNLKRYNILSEKILKIQDQLSSQKILIIILLVLCIILFLYNISRVIYNILNKDDDFDKLKKSILDYLNDQFRIVNDDLRVLKNKGYTPPAKDNGSKTKTDDDPIEKKVTLQPQVFTKEAEQLNPQSATLYGVIRNCDKPVSCYFEYDTSKTYRKKIEAEIIKNFNSDTLEEFRIKATVYNLSPKTRYYYRAVLNVNGKLIKGADLFFITLPSPPPSLKIRQFFLPNPFADGTFNVKDESEIYEDGKSIYLFFTTNEEGTEASFEFYPHESTFLRVKGLPSSYLDPVCDTVGGIKSDTKKINSFATGTAYKRGEKWVVPPNNKAKVEYE